MILTRLDVEGDDRLADGGSLLGLLLGVLCQSLLLECLSLLVNLLVVRAKQVNIVLVVSGGSGDGFGLGRRDGLDGGS